MIGYIEVRFKPSVKIFGNTATFFQRLYLLTCSTYGELVTKEDYLVKIKSVQKIKTISIMKLD